MPNALPRLPQGTKAAGGTFAPGAARPWLWLQIVVGWLPIWGLYTTIVYTQHAPIRFVNGALIGLHAIIPAAALGLVVNRVTRRFRWPHPFRLWFAGLHLLFAVTYSVAWIVSVSLMESTWHHELIIVAGGGLIPFLILGVWIYVMVAGVSYASQATQRAAQAELVATQSQLAALRAQLHPHFLFNALHTVVQLIPRDPARAAQAAEQIAGLLRTTIEQDRDLITLGEEWNFVDRYLDIERIRFGDRLVVRAEMSEDASQALVPSFALQTLVENAVRHGAAPRIDATTITITAVISGNTLTVRVHDDAAGASAELMAQTTGTGLSRLRERLVGLYAGQARLDIRTSEAGGFEAALTLPLSPAPTP